MKEAFSSYKSINTILGYFGIIKEDYWHINYKINKKEDFKKKYYWDLKKKYILFNGKKDKKGIPLYLGADNKYYYSVIFLGHYSIAAYQVYLETGEINARNEFLKINNWLIENMRKYKETEGIWINRYPMDVFKLEGMWSSALAQAKGISSLTRAFLETQDEKYLKAALKAKIAFTKHINQGGVLYENNEFICFEEYTTKENSSVLNGFIFAIWSISDLLNIIKNKEEYKNDKKELEILYGKSLNFLKNNIQKWDLKYWSKYDLWVNHNNISSYFYHDLHIKQLKILFELTGENIFNEYSLKWKKYQKNKYFCLLALLKKIIFRLKK